MSDRYWTEPRSNLVRIMGKHLGQNGSQPDDHQHTDDLPRGPSVI